MKYVAFIVLCFMCGCVKSPTPINHNFPPTTKICGSGRMEGASEEIYLGFLITGIVKEINVKEGDTVKSGDILVVLDNQEYQNRVSLADASKRMSEAQLAYEKKHYERANSLFLKKSTSHEEVEYGFMKLSEAQAKVDATDAELKVAQNILDKTVLRSPIDGMVIHLDIHVGEHVDTQPIIVMADVSKFCIRAFVDEYDALKVKTGMKAKITHDGSDSEFHGKVAKLGHRMTNKEIITNHPGERLDTKVREIWIDLVDPIDDFVVGLLVDVEIGDAT